MSVVGALFVMFRLHHGNFLYATPAKLIKPIWLLTIFVINGVLMDAQSRDMRGYLLNFLPPKSLCALSETSSKFHAAADREWERRVKEEFGVEKHPKFDQERSWGEIWWEHANEQRETCPRRYDIANMRCHIRRGEELDTYKGASALSYACEYGITEMVQFMLENGADPNLQIDQFGHTALWTACEFRSIDCVRALLENGANVDAKTLLGSIPLLYFCSSPSYVDIVKCLLEFGADTTVTYSNGRGIHDCAHPDVLSLLTE